MIKVTLPQNFINHAFLFGVWTGVEPGLAGDEGITAPTGSLPFKFSRVGHSLHPWQSHL